MQIASIRPIAVRSKSDQPDGYEVDIQVEWLSGPGGQLASSVYFSVVTVPLLATPDTTTDRIAATGLSLFRAALDSTEPSDVRLTLELAIGGGSTAMSDEAGLSSFSAAGS
ncbi:hypothetical protein OL229_13705 [Neisseriaceae bacterium JH1-16]|nr:hypothetical protein [Neisseriaceae bacterium JH1-16]